MMVWTLPLAVAAVLDKRREMWPHLGPKEELRSMFEKQAGVEKFDLIQSFHACKQKEGKPVADYVLKMKGYVEQLERLDYVLPQDISVGLILNGPIENFAGFVRNYNMHNMGKTIGELHAMLIEYEKGLPKKAETPQVMMIKNGKIQKANKKSLKAKGKNKVIGKGKDKKVYVPKPKNPKPTALERPAKDDACHTARRIEKKLKRGALYLYVGNGVPEQVEAIGSYDLVLPNGLVICLDNCHYAPTIVRGVVSVSRLVDNGFVQCFTHYGISISKNNVLYFNDVARNGVYEIDMHNLVPNVNSMYNVSNKRAKRNLDSTYLWHCCLAHINKKRIKQLQQDGLLKSTDDESFDQCESCLSGKMTKKPFPHSNERAKDLLGIIHTDVCGPLRHVSRQDRGGGIYSQEFKDYLKANGIVQHLTPPYTPQHNGVSERRNHTLLDMVRSMMNLTTLPISFWDYALESATRILNMVLTKKVDKTPYEMWYGNVPNLSYLKVWGCEALVKRDTPDKLEQRSVKCIFIGYPKETMGYNFYFPPENKIVVARYAEFFEKRLINQEINWRAVDLEEIQEQEDTLLSEITSKIPQEVEGFGPPPQEEEILIRRRYGKWNGKNLPSLNGYLDEDIYMVQPEGFIDLTSQKSMQATRSIYGLKQASRSWNKRFYEEIKRFGFAQNLDEPWSIMYAVRCTRPHVAFTQNITSQFQQNPGELHWTAVKNILKYLRNTKDMFLVYGGNPSTELRVDCYCDARFETDRDDTKSQTGYVFVLNGGAVDWKSSMQSSIAMSATESEYIAASEAAMEAVWIRKFISGLGVVPMINRHINKYCDNLVAVHYANEPGVQKGARHYQRRYHYVRELCC
ncbi:retrotransposon protein, putative, ty1-copia subclass [Tanacetum coccineum]|uniref:Retrotransposon protein, putative, ty1-copia subclass n=1 Tax=Tanacetum coccineum TaxID=301880 RepID=A0ABQ5D6L7_9ASTR